MYRTSPPQIHVRSRRKVGGRGIETVDADWGAQVNEQLPEGYGFRPATLDDASAIAELINDDIRGEIGIPWTNAEEVRDTLTSPTRDLALVHSVLIDGSPKLAGYVEFHVTKEPLEVHLLCYVRRDLHGRGVSASVIRLAEDRIAWKRHADLPAKARLSCFSHNQAARRLFATLGYDYSRTFWVMTRDLDAPPPVPSVAAGVEIRPFRSGADDLRVHTALSEAFADHWGPPFPSFEEWRHREIEGEGAGFDPGLWFVAVEADEVVAAITAQASTSSDNTTYVSDLAVLRPWRRRGIGLALLQTVFGEAYRRGTPRVELAVDSESPTGATRLYERAGMRTTYSWETWEKRIDR
jgi:mycothiol synthase